MSFLTKYALPCKYNFFDSIALSLNEMFLSMLIVLLAVTMSCNLVEMTVQETQISRDIVDWNDMMDVMAPVRDGNLPIAQRLVEIAPRLNRSDHGAWQEYATEIAPKALAIYQGALKEWMNIAPNSSGDIFQYYKSKSRNITNRQRRVND